MTAAVKVRSTHYYYGGVILDGQYARASWRDWIVDTSSGCGCEIGDVTGCEPVRVYADLGHALDFAREHAETHTCPSRRASGEPCSPYCTDCGGKGWVA